MRLAICLCLAHLIILTACVKSPKATQNIDSKQIEHTHVSIPDASEKAGHKLKTNVEQHQRKLKTQLSKLYTTLTLSVWQYEHEIEKELDDKESSAFISTLAYNERLNEVNQKISVFRRRKAEIMSTANKLADNATDTSFENVINTISSYIANE